MIESRKKPLLTGLTPVLFSWYICLSILIINPTLFFADPVLDRDDKLLLAPLIKVHSLSDYWSAVQTRKIVDRQPIRDLSFLLNIKIFKVFKVFQAKNFAGLHLTNLILWGLILWTVLSLFALLFKQASLQHYALVLLLGWHPSLLTSVYWISGRKHLLATLGILLATRALLKFLHESWSTRQLWLMVIFYGLAVFSHPIGLLWPLWAWVMIKSVATPTQIPTLKRWGLALLLLALMTTVMALNYFYYQQEYTQQNDIPKLVQQTESTLWYSILGLARSFYQILCPTTLSADYYAGSWENMLGIPLATVFFAGLWRIMGRAGILYLLFIFFPLLTIYTRATNIFVSDTYLLLPAIGIGAMLAAVWKRRSPRRSRLLTSPQLLILVTAIFYLYQNVDWSRAWNTDEAVWEYSYPREKSLQVLINYALIRQERGDYRAALEAILIARDMDSYYFYFPYTFANVIHQIPQRVLTIDQKLKLLASAPNQRSYIIYAQGVLLAHQKKWEVALTKMQRGMLTNPKLKQDIPEMLAELEYTCQQSAVAATCPELLAPFQQLLHSANSPELNYRYQARKREIEKQQDIL